MINFLPPSFVFASCVGFFLLVFLYSSQEPLLETKDVDCNIASGLRVFFSLFVICLILCSAQFTTNKYHSIKSFDSNSGYVTYNVFS